MHTFRQEHDVIKEVVGLRGGLQQGYKHGGGPQVAELPQGASDLEGGAAVQASADLIQEQGLLGTHQQLSWCSRGGYLVCTACQDLLVENHSTLDDADGAGDCIK